MNGPLSTVEQNRPACGERVEGETAARGYSRRKRPQTAHRHDVPASVTITRKRHAFEGRALSVISTIRRRGIHYLLAVLPDGSRSLIPASWTDWNAEPIGRMPPIDADDAIHNLGRLVDLLRLRKLGSAQGL